MKIKMWCLVNREKNSIIKVWLDKCYVIGFETKRGLLDVIGRDQIADDEEMKEIETEV